MTGVVSVPFSGILCKMKVEIMKRVGEIQHIDIHVFDHSIYKLTLLGVWIGDRASRSVMGNSRPRLLRSS